MAVLVSGQVLVERSALRSELSLVCLEGLADVRRDAIDGVPIVGAHGVERGVAGLAGQRKARGVREVRGRSEGARVESREVLLDGVR
jgi:hypothetical protein